MPRAIPLCLLTIIAGALIACASRTEIPETDVETLRAGGLKFEKVFVKEYTADPAVENPAATLAVCQEVTISYLASKNLFQRVESYQGNPGPDAAVVEAHLTDLRIVSGSARFWGGAFAGRSYMKMHVRILDSAGRVLAEQDLEGAPNAYGSAWSFGSADRNLPASMGGLIGEYVLSNAGK